jgi:hypothetical protein
MGVSVLRRREGEEVDTGAARWLLGAFVIGVVVLALVAPSLATIVPGLPNDHYHNLLDPIVLALSGVGLARIAARLGTATRERTAIIGRTVAGALGAVLVVIAVTGWPPPVSPDGGWPLADRTAGEALSITGGSAWIALDGLPEFKNDNAMRFPLERRGARLYDPEFSMDGAAWWYLVCDPLFDTATGKPCGGDAEAAWVASTPGLPPLQLWQRLEGGPRRTLSIYGAAPAP